MFKLLFLSTLTALTCISSANEDVSPALCESNTHLIKDGIFGRSFSCPLSALALSYKDQNDNRQVTCLQNSASILQDDGTFFEFREGQRFTFACLSIEQDSSGSQYLTIVSGLSSPPLTSRSLQ